MGKAAALEVISHGGSVLLVSRSAAKLQIAKEGLLRQVPEAEIDTFPLDITKEDEVQSFVQSKLSDTTSSSSWDGLVITAAGRAAHGPFESLPTHKSREMLESKFWGAYYCAKYIGPCLNPGGSIVFCGGILNRRPGKNCSSLSCCNGALEGLTRSLALEWGPPPRQIRVNCLSPGFCDTERCKYLSK